LGDILLTANNEALTGLSFLTTASSTLLDEQVIDRKISGELIVDHKNISKPMLLSETCIQLDQYFSSQRSQFSIPLNPQATVFQKKYGKY
jgi:O6-methylguanine-DNA--protein-cysteine methyltransferase